MNFASKLSGALKWFDTDKFSTGCSGCLVVRDDGKLLLIKTKKGLEIPKGHIKDKEDSVKAAVREVLEETGYESYPLFKICEVGSKNNKTVFYLATLVGGKPKPRKKEGIVKIIWLSPQKAIDKIIKWQKPVLQRMMETNGSSSTAGEESAPST